MNNLSLKINNFLILLFFNFSLLLFFSFFIYIYIGSKDTISSILGGITSIIPSFLFFYIYFFLIKDNSIRIIVRKFYISGLVKFISFIIFLLFSFFIGISNIFLFFIFLFFFQMIFWIECIYFFYRM